MNSNFSNNSFSYFQDPRRVMGTKFSWKELGRSDVAGAAWGAAACGVARFFGPLGWKVWVIGIVGSAAGGSAYNAVDQLLK